MAGGSVAAEAVLAVLKQLSHDIRGENGADAVDGSKGGSACALEPASCRRRLLQT